MLTIDISHNIEQERRWLRKAQRKQVPFAASNTINALAFRCMRAAREETKTTFKLTKQFVPRGIRVNKSNKKTLSAWIGFINKDGSPDERYWFMSDQTFGGTRTPKKATHLAVPNFRVVKRKQTSGYKNLKAIEVGGSLGLYRTYKRKAPKRFFSLRKRQNVKKIYPFFAVTHQIINDNFKKEWNKAISKALRTAR